MKKRHIFVLLFFSIISVFIVGFFSLSINTARSSYIFIVLGIIYLAGIWIRGYFDNYNVFAVFFLSGAGLLFYFITALFFKAWLTPPVLCFLLYTLAFFCPFRRHIVLVALVLILSFYFSWFWYPNKLLIEKPFNFSIFENKTKRAVPFAYFEMDSLILIDKNGVNAIGQFTDNIVFIETWNERCGACIHAMKDLHPFLEALEQKNRRFRHYYLYTTNIGGALDPKSVFSHRLLPYPDMPVLYDVNQVFYQGLPEGGFPHFLVFNQKGICISEFQGYNHNFTHVYKRQIKKVINEIKRKQGIE